MSKMSISDLESLAENIEEVKKARNATVLGTIGVLAMNKYLASRENPSEAEVNVLNKTRKFLEEICKSCKELHSLAALSLEEGEK